jgi:hypothetical protein
MKQIVIKRENLTKLYTMCSSELIKYVFDAFKSYGGKIIVDEKNQENDIWELEIFHNDTVCNKLEAMKVMSAFAQNGMFSVNGKLMFFEGIVLTENHKEGSLVNQMWYNCKYNGLIPYFNLNELKIPQIMPRYTYTKISEICYRIDRWDKDKYIPTDQYFPTLEMCQNQIEELEKYQMI